MTRSLDNELLWDKTQRINSYINKCGYENILRND